MRQHGLGSPNPIGRGEAAGQHIDQILSVGSCLPVFPVDRTKLDPLGRPRSSGPVSAGPDVVDIITYLWTAVRAYGTTLAEK